MKRKPVKLAVSEYGRSIVYIASASWYGRQATASCVFATREEAIRWAKSAVRTYSDVDIDAIPQAWRQGYPDERFRDDVRLNPTFHVAWADGSAEVEKAEVCGLYDWSARPFDAVTPAIRRAFEKSQR